MQVVKLKCVSPTETPLGTQGNTSRGPHSTKLWPLKKNIQQHQVGHLQRLVGLLQRLVTCCVLCLSHHLPHGDGFACTQ